MKNFVAICGLLLILVSCAGNNDGNSGTGENGESGTNPSAIDTTQHATGITNQNVISTDTAAMRVDTFVR